MIIEEAHFLGRAPIDAYGNGGFRFAEMSHRGSIMLLPSGIYRWDVAVFDELTLRSFSRVLAESSDVELLLLGTGTTLRPPGEALRQAFRDNGVFLEIMDSGAAARTYNVLLAEQRAVAAALIAVD